MLQVYPNVTDNRQAALPPGSFLTCSSDDTVRVWNIEEGDDNFCSLWGFPFFASRFGSFYA